MNLDRDVFGFHVEWKQARRAFRRELKKGNRLPLVEAYILMKRTGLCRITGIFEDEENVLSLRTAVLGAYGLLDQADRILTFLLLEPKISWHRVMDIIEGYIGVQCAMMEWCTATLEAACRKYGGPLSELLEELQAAEWRGERLEVVPYEDLDAKLTRKVDELREEVLPMIRKVEPCILVESYKKLLVYPWSETWPGNIL